MNYQLILYKREKKKKKLLSLVEHNLDKSGNNEKKRLEIVEASDTILSIIGNKKR